MFTLTLDGLTRFISNHIWKTSFIYWCDICYVKVSTMIDLLNLYIIHAFTVIPSQCMCSIRKETCRFNLFSRSQLQLYRSS